MRHTLELRSTDKKGNVESGNVVAFNVFDLETPVGGAAGGAVPATLVADARHGRGVRRLHAGRRPRVHGDDHAPS